MPRTYILYKGTHTLDISHLEGHLFDLSEGGRRGMRTVLEGFDGARSELANSSEVHRNAAGMHPGVFEHFQMCSGRISSIDEKLAVALKQVEVLVESRAFYVDAQQNDISLLVDAMRSFAQRRRDRSVLVPFEQTLSYASQIGDKGARTKRRRAEEAAAAPRAPKAKAEAKGKKAKTKGARSQAMSPQPAAAKSPAAALGASGGDAPAAATEPGHAPHDG